VVAKLNWNALGSTTYSQRALERGGKAAHGAAVMYSGMTVDSSRLPSDESFCPSETGLSLLDTLYEKKAFRRAMAFGSQNNP
jgi:hypothetical protein